MTPQTGIGPALAVAAAAVLSCGRSYRRFDWCTGEAERHRASTADGWSLALYRYRPPVARYPCPVVCGHGMAGTRLIFDLHPDYSLARHLAAAGFDVWLVDLRGRGNSWPDGGPRPELQWSFDDFAARDLPAAVERACELTGSAQAFWLGMEMSGQALYAAAVLGRTGQVRGGVTCGSPVVTPPTAQVPGITSPPRVRRGGRVPFRAGSRLAGPVLAYGGFSAIANSFRAGNYDPLVVARYFRNGVPDEATDLVEQFDDWIRTGRMASRDGTIVYSERLGEVQLPLLLLAAGRDLQRPPASVCAAYEALGSGDKTFVRAGIADGFSVDFGHDDLLAGLAAPREVFPRVATWLAERS